MSKIIIALDFKNREQANQFLSKFGNEKLFLKIGMELFYKEGKQYIEQLSAKNHRIFLDLKLYDIPTTVQKAIQNLNDLPIEFLTIHLSGGIEMLKKAQAISKAKLLGVTLLTSQSSIEVSSQIRDEQSFIKEQYEKAQKAKLSGIICSPKDCKLFNQQTNLLLVTPGIRLGADHNDQKRVTTPQDAAKLGSDYLVIGREITKAKDPYQMYLKITKEFENGKKNNN